jgi:hypothetical protein
MLAAGDACAHAASVPTVANITTPMIHTDLLKPFTPR